MLIVYESERTTMKRFFVFLSLLLTLSLISCTKIEETLNTSKNTTDSPTTSVTSSIMPQESTVNYRRELTANEMWKLCETSEQQFIDAFMGKTIVVNGYISSIYVNSIIISDENNGSLISCDFGFDKVEEGKSKYKEEGDMVTIVGTVSKVGLLIHLEDCKYE